MTHDEDVAQRAVIGQPQPSAAEIVEQAKTSLTHDSHQTDEDKAIALRNRKLQKRWTRRMRIFFCCLGYKRNKESLSDVASVFAEFYYDRNVSFSDMMAGFRLLAKCQAAQREWTLEHDKERSGIEQYLSGVPIRADTEFLDISLAEDSHLVNDLIHYMNYSLAVFGWPLHLVDDPGILCCIYPHLKISSCCSGQKKRRTPAKHGTGESETSGESKSKIKAKSAKVGVIADSKLQASADDQHGKSVSDKTQSGGKDVAEARGESSSISEHELPIVVDDNCCGCNVAAARRRLAERNYELIYISYKSLVNVVPFLVVADHSKRAIVVAIRGSAQIADMVTDMNVKVDKLPIDDCPDDWLCHRGMTNAAVYVKSTLLRERVLERAFNCRLDLGSHEYQLIFCGHSLGAGTAAILGVLMRKQYPTLKAYLYSPPGGLLSMPVVEYTKEFAYGVTLGYDSIARCGLAQMERVRYHTLLALSKSGRSPSNLLARSFCPSICCRDIQMSYDPDSLGDLLHGVDSPTFDYKGTKIHFQSQPELLYIPGRLIHVVRNYSLKSKGTKAQKEPIYQAIWTDNADYDRLLISEGMFSDHLPQNLMHAMKMLLTNTVPGSGSLKRDDIKHGEQ